MATRGDKNNKSFITLPSNQGERLDRLESDTHLESSSLLWFLTTEVQ